MNQVWKVMRIDLYSLQISDHDDVSLDDSTLNLIKNYAYHRHKQLHVPMSDAQSELTERIVQELSLTIKTILRI